MALILWGRLDDYSIAIGISCLTASKNGCRTTVNSRRRAEHGDLGTLGRRFRLTPPELPPAVPILEAEHLEKTFGTGDHGGAGVAAVRGIDLAVRQGEFVAITGASGSGKSTLLHMLGGITRPSSGRVLLEGVDLASLDDDALAVVRRRRIGFVFQRYNLLPELSLAENVALPLVLDGASEARADEAALAALETVGMGHRARHRPDELSGGEQQRGAIARALVAKPAIVLADEPTGALDSVNSKRVVELLGALVADRGQTVILVTHDAGVAAAAGRTIRISDGLVASDSENGAPGSGPLAGNGR
jgi:putative ABC transport system ATP-binding protein